MSSLPSGRLVPDFNTFLDCRRDNGAAIRAACRRCVLVCRRMGLLPAASVASGSSKLTAVKARHARPAGIAG